MNQDKAKGPPKGLRALQVETNRRTLGKWWCLSQLSRKVALLNYGDGGCTVSGKNSGAEKVSVGTLGRC